jgi:hypothetical protein
MNLKQKKATYDQTQTAYSGITKLMATDNFSFISPDQETAYANYEKAITDILNPELGAEQVLGTVNSLQQLTSTSLYKDDTEGVTRIENNFTKTIKSALEEGIETPYTEKAKGTRRFEIEGTVKLVQNYKVKEKEFIDAYKASMLSAQGNTKKTLQQQAWNEAKRKKINPKEYSIDQYLTERGKTLADMLGGQVTMGGTKQNPDGSIKTPSVGKPITLSDVAYEPLQSQLKSERQYIQEISLDGAVVIPLPSSEKGADGTALQIEGKVTNVIFDGGTKPSFYVVSVAGNASESLSMDLKPVKVSYNEREQKTLITVPAYKYQKLEERIADYYDKKNKGEYTNQKKELKLKPEKKGSNIANDKKEEQKRQPTWAERRAQQNTKK